MTHFFPSFALFLSFSGESKPSCDYSELFSLPPSSLDGGDVGYLNQAATELTSAMEQEKKGEFSSAIRGYRTAVDILITGVQGEKTHEGIQKYVHGTRGRERNRVFICSLTE